ncbi:MULTISPECIES: Helicase associated domain protein [Giesbergeria]|uniref:Helicase associated domain protein n=1 Tax=Giesbergeria sinuosa TaxID=80883 RepID=A0ABV9QBX2_9BURK
MSQGKPIPITTPLSHFTDRLPVIAQFIAREGHAHIPLQQQEDGHPIGYWCSNWRFRIETAIDTIPHEQLEALRRIGFLEPAGPVPPAPSDTPVTNDEDCIGIPAEWMQSPQKPQEPTWLLPVGSLRPTSPLPANPMPLQPKIEVKKKRQLQIYR